MKGSRDECNDNAKPDGGEGEVGSSKARLPELVDKLELALAKCLADYRERAEEELLKHLEEVEQAQNFYEHQIAALTMENCVLRSQLGHKSSEQLQNVILRPEPAKAAGKPRNQRVRIEDRDSWDNCQTLKSSKTRERVPAVPAGSWQPLMAWVPHGAALRNPEPWKPLPTQEQGISPNHLEDRRPTVTPTGPLAILPGSVPESPAHTHPVMPCMKESITRVKDIDSESDSGSSSHSDGNSQEKREYGLIGLWVASAKQQQKMMKNKRSETPSSVAFRDEDDDSKKKPRWFIVNPDSLSRVSWDCFSLVIISYDIVTVPLDVFALPPSAFLTFFDWLTRLFWTFDIGWSCVTGIVLSDGIVENEPSAILARYGKSWFVPDLAMVASDWIGLILGSSLNISQLARSTRIARAVRLVRLLRMQEVLASLSERIQSDIIESALQILKLLMVLAAVSHFMACLWWAIGSRKTEEQEPTWIKANDFEKLDVGMQYLICLNWSLGLFVGSSDEVVPVAAVERFYAAIAGMGAYILTLVLLATLTSGQTQRHIIEGNGARQMSVLKTYLRQNSVPKNLAKRLCRNANHAISGDLNADAVQLLGVISTPLKVQMHFEIYSRIMACHPFFYDLLQDGNALLRRIFHQAMDMLLLTAGDTVFALLEDPTEPKMYAVVAGSLDYCDAYGEVVPVRESDFVSEAVLWTHWRHQGTLSATDDVKLALLDAQMFQELCKNAIMKKNPACLPIMAYAAEFVKELNEQERPTDLPAQAD